MTIRRHLDRYYLLGTATLFCVMLSAAQADELSDVPEVYQRAIEEKVELAEDVIERGPYEADFEDLSRHVEAPEWYRDAKFGIYFHWGVYSVPEAGNEWYPCNMHQADKDRFNIHDHHVKTYGSPLEHPYDDFVSGFTAEKFDADRWVDLFVQSGAKFIGPVAEHHDGYSMWQSNVTPWNVVDTGPQRDITGELAKAARRRGLKFMTSFHHARNGIVPGEKNMRQHWHYAGALEHYPQLLEDPQRAMLYGYMPRERFEQLWLAKLVEVIDAYQPDLIWFDSWLHSISEERRAQFLAYYLNRAKEWDREVVITFKQDDLPSDIGLEDFERGRLNKLSEHCWLTDDTITDDRSWCYIQDVKLKKPGYLVQILADIVGKNGCLLLNVAPRADGTIPEDQRQILLELGDWLKTNGEAIYATRPWQIFGEGPTRLEEGGGFVEEVEYTSEDIRFTRSQDGRAVYVIALGRPPGKEITVEAMGVDRDLLPDGISSVELLGSPEKVEWRRDAESLHLGFPEKVAGKYAFVWKITPN